MVLTKAHFLAALLTVGPKGDPLSSPRQQPLPEWSLSGLLHSGDCQTKTDPEVHSLDFAH